MGFRFEWGRNQQYGRISAGVAAILCLLLSALGIAIAVGGGRLEGGIPLIPDEWNQTIGRIIFGAGAILTGGLAVLAIRDAIQPAPPPEIDDP